jgi:hypothetical protein
LLLGDKQQLEKMAWRKGNMNSNPEPIAVVSAPETSKPTPHEGHLNQQTEKFLILNILHKLLEAQMISDANHQLCKDTIIAQAAFDAKTIMSYAPPHWLKTSTQKQRDNFPSASLGSCILLLHEIGAHVGVYV